MRFSVVIPTYNRSEILSQCLQALFTQDFDKSQYEIVVVDDGSQDATQETLKKFQKKSPVPLKFFHHKNCGQGVARNRGIVEALGEIILLLGDDMIAAPQLLKEHDRMHRRHPEGNAAVLGFITWHPKLAVTPLMRFMEQGGAILGRFGGHQFAFDLLRGKHVADYRFFYTSNISLKRSLLAKFKFDPWFSGYGWEDIELGYRLTKEAGLVLYYEPAALAYHDHMMNELQFINRMRSIGRSCHGIQEKYPELQRMPSQKKQLIFKMLSNPISLGFFKRLNRNLYFYALSKKYFLEGLKQGYNKK
ncbi:glycosyltransferase family 2 protein [Candidatus Peregrinibacteria bacterium]|nr:glycosyltransferase family 2 protein [Candidatus Peregrinibacteria bacterium]